MGEVTGVLEWILGYMKTRLFGCPIGQVNQQKIRHMLLMLIVNSPLADIRQAIHRPAPESRGCARMHAPLRSSRYRFQRPGAVGY